MGIVAAFCRVAFVSPKSVTDPSMWFEMVYTRSCAWMIAWLLMLSLKFNPFMSCGTRSPNDTRMLAKVGDLSRIGRWVMEYERVEQACARLQPKVEAPRSLRLSAAEACRVSSADARLSKASSSIITQSTHSLSGSISRSLRLTASVSPGDCDTW